MRPEFSNTTLVAVCSALALTSWIVCLLLIRRHFLDFSQRSIQLLILNIIALPPFYSLGSTFSLIFPSIAIYLDILIECYMSYCLYSFFLLMMFMLGCEEDDFKLVSYLETKTSFQLGFPLNVLCSKDLARGKAFLLYCRSGILQLCFLKPLIVVTSLVLDELHVYNEFSSSARSGYLYLLVVLNLSVFYAFAALFAFYTVFKMKLKPFHASNKFTWIVCVVFMTFWQSVIVTGLVQGCVVSDLRRVSTPLVPTRIQDLLVCIEMLIASVSCWWVFSYEPYTSGYVNPYDYSDYDEEVDVYERSSRPGVVGTNYRYSMLNTAAGGDEEEGLRGTSKSNRSNSSRRPVTSSISGNRATLAFTDPSKMSSTAVDSKQLNGDTGSEESGSGKARTTKKYRSFRGPSDMLRRFSNSSSTAPLASNKEAKVNLLPSTGGPTEYTTARTISSSSSSGGAKTAGVSLTKTNKAEDEDGAAYQNVTDELPEDVMLLLGAKKGSRGAKSGASTAAVVKDMNDFGHDGEATGGSVLLRTIQSKYADAEYEVDVSRSSLSSTGNNDISQLSASGAEVNNPLVKSQHREEEESEAVGSWAGKTMKERMASMEQRLVDSGAASGNSNTSATAAAVNPKVNVIKKVTTVTKKTKKHRHNSESSSETVHESL